MVKYKFNGEFTEAPMQEFAQVWLFYCCNAVTAHVAARNIHVPYNTSCMRHYHTRTPRLGVCCMWTLRGRMLRGRTAVGCLGGPLLHILFRVCCQGVIDGKVARHLRSEPLPAEPNPNTADGDFVKARQPVWQHRRAASDAHAACSVQH